MSHFAQNSLIAPSKWMGCEETARLVARAGRRALLYSSAAVLVLLAAISVAYWVFRGEREQKQIAEEEKKLSDVAQHMMTSLSGVRADLAYLSRTEIARRSLEPEGQEARRDMASLMTAMMSTRRRYDQLRLLDARGREVIRLNFDENAGPTRVPEGELQDKSGRYYVEECLHLEAGETYVSRFDLNVEQGRVETPRKPMIRFCSRITSARGLTLGIAVINYLGAALLEAAPPNQRHNPEQWYLVDSGGFYLRGPSAESEFRFMDPLREPLGFASEFASSWRVIRPSNRGRVQTPEGRFQFMEVSPLDSPQAAGATEPWKLILHVPRWALDAADRQLRREVAWLTVVLGLGVVWLSWLLGRAQIKQAWLFGQLERSALLDGLTGLLNYRAAVASLSQLIALARRKKKPLTVVFIDINDLKLINDMEGHDAGDRLLRGAGQAIRASLRNSDIAARLGGDEFLVVLPDCDLAGAESSMQRNASRFSEAGVVSTGRPWSMSWGCAELDEDAQTPDQLIELADRRMYEQKRRLKQLRDSDTRVLVAKRACL